MLDSTTLRSIPTPSVIQTLLAIPFVLITISLLTWLTTTINWYHSISQFKSRTKNPSSTLKPIAPPLLPYAIPWLGSALTFLNENPGSFWRMLRAKLASTGTNMQVCTILLGGQKAHVVNSAAAVQALFKSKNVSRDLFNRQIAIQGLGTSKADADIMFPSAPTSGHIDSKVDTMDALNHEFLLSQSAANSLMSKFMDFFRSLLDNVDLDSKEWKQVDLLAWWKKVMFNASTGAVLGTKILEMNPNLADQFWEYDAGFLARFYGLPRFIKPRAYACLDEMLDKTEAWVEYVLAEHGGDPPEEPDWEPLMGSKVVRARHRYYNREGLSSRGRAAFDLGLLFGLQSNVIPITSWILAHLLSPLTPADVLVRVQEEIGSARRPDNEVDISILVAQPLLNSIVHETLRHYVDALVTRQLKVDMVLDGYLLKKDDLVMAPSSLSQHDPQFWEQDTEPPADAWYAERFLKQDPTTGKQTFSTSWTAGKFFPFGGGTHVCPGRIFAKQEILGALATLLLKFDLRFVEYLGTDKNGSVVSLGKGAAGFPKVRKQYAGNGTLSMDGDIRVQMRAR
ncbi:cytochrome P450, family 7, subfamily B [Exophiala viscosa]|uniref:Cytochrome P450, family 7, subfamily B n=1 Tax=Exophiala viscosa TaxID=2486360 RepID=A0AAN6DNT0_9EURO|nr:cytochrome P450, family 7, subfamily B [Exophiala viscosa]